MNKESKEFIETRERLCKVLEYNESKAGKWMLPQEYYDMPDDQTISEETAQIIRNCDAFNKGLMQQYLKQQEEEQLKDKTKLLGM